jgi:hypothetical protein
LLKPEVDNENEHEHYENGHQNATELFQNRGERGPGDLFKFGRDGFYFSPQTNEHVRLFVGVLLLSLFVGFFDCGLIILFHILDFLLSKHSRRIFRSVAVSVSA